MDIETEKCIGAYKNGNYEVVLFEDGTKIRYNNIEPTEGQSPDDCFIADFPESMDVTITHRCNAGCAMCYAGCTMAGNNADIMNAKWVDSLMSYTEMAIGGGNVFEHPDLIPFLGKLKKKKVIANITVNQRHFMEYFDDIQNLLEEGLIKGVGISVFYATDELMSAIMCVPNAVVHCIVGITSVHMLEELYDHDVRLLLLGYKTTGRGGEYENQHMENIRKNIADLNAALPEILNHFRVVAFDNMALKQLDVRSHLTEEQWNTFYMGDDGIDGKITSATMFIDMVDNTYAVNSMSGVQFQIADDDTPASMFQFLQRR